MLSAKETKGWLTGGSHSRAGCPVIFTATASPLTATPHHPSSWAHKSWARDPGPTLRCLCGRLVFQRRRQKTQSSRLQEKWPSPDRDQTRGWGVHLRQCPLPPGSWPAGTSVHWSPEKCVGFPRPLQMPAVTSRRYSSNGGHCAALGNPAGSPAPWHCGTCRSAAAGIRLMVKA